jgi:predicted nucleic acid-binding protein
MFILDTNVVSELRTGKSDPSPNVLAWAQSTPFSSYYLTSISIFELEMGVLKLERRQQGARLRIWLEGIKATFSGRILTFDAAAAVACSRMHVPDPKSLRDSMTAAIALQSGLTVATRNVSDFEDTGVQIMNPWLYVAPG